ncbi:DUF979 domain-containing protein [Luteolibacter ambystomatis]|uniref:DUF979 domain-containing protein n=1 Tax=Luteolibacter ambystomatis TaxID=2824561 RepID=A0A975J158_9BACT|nr:DUF979 domain-containing protein [Luteolibacter ambystomatis]QUE52115.1 DUF979 domain-containing protein [Luteolibacter ambystomatis]
MTLVSLQTLYVIAGILLTCIAINTVKNRAHLRRVGTALFWGALAAIYLFGGHLPPLAIGWIMLGLVALAATRQITAPKETPVPAEQRASEALRLGNRIFIPALVIPATAVVSTLVLSKIPLGGVRLFDPKQPTLAALGLGSLLALIVALRMTRAKPRESLHEGGRLLHAIGWAMLLPQLLAALGGIFTKAGVGEVIARLVTDTFPTGNPFVAVVVYCVGMALFTICLGNAFAAFPVITLGVGLPIIVQQHHGNPAIMAAIGMLSGYCGTLLTPMAANFNLVPAMLLELRDPHAVIKAQAPIGLTLLAVNILILDFCVYRF